MTMHVVIPDTQIRHGDDMEFLQCIGRFIAKKQPDVVVHLGDMVDMESLSSYDVGKKSYEGRRYLLDIEAGIQAQTALWQPIVELNETQRTNKKKIYNPKTVFLCGNHEFRINKAVENDAKLDGLLSIDDLQLTSYWQEVYPFLQVVVIDGVAYSHYFTSGQLGRPCASAQAQLTKKHMSCIAGHQQGLQIATGYKADGNPITAIIAGSCYETPHDYLGPQGNTHWNGIIVLHDVHDGTFDPMFVSLKYLKQKYANM